MSKEDLILLITVPRIGNVRVRVSVAHYQLATSRTLNGDLRSHKRNVSSRSYICIKTRRALERKYNIKTFFLTWQSLQIEVVGHLHKDEEFIEDTPYTAQIENPEEQMKLF